MNKSVDERSIKRIASFEPREQIMDTQQLIVCMKMNHKIIFFFNFFFLIEQNGSNELNKMAPEDMTSKEYYLDSTAHFAVHEVCRKKKKKEGAK